MNKIYFALGLMLCCSAFFAHTPLITIASNGDGTIYIQDGFSNGVEKIKGFREFYSIHKGKRQDLLSELKQTEFASSENTVSAYSFILDKSDGASGGDWVLIAIPHPYWEAANDAYIQQVTKAFINKDGLATDWQARCAEGYPEIIPLVKPYDVLAGGVFSAVVLNSAGKPVPNAKVEFEYINFDVEVKGNKFTDEKKLEKAGIGMILADPSGVFAFVPPKAGYWGFAALGTGNKKEFSGKPLSQDAVIWIEAFESGIKEKTDSAEDSFKILQKKDAEKKISPAALIIVILLFVVLFAWPPIFKKMSAKKELEESK